MARSLAKLMTCKDAYEVARIYSSPEVMASVRAEYTGDDKLELNLAPPLLAKLKVLRGTAFDVAGCTADRSTKSGRSCQRNSAAAPSPRWSTRQPDKPDSMEQAR